MRMSSTNDAVSSIIFLFNMNEFTEINQLGQNHTPMYGRQVTNYGYEFKDCDCNHSL